MKVEKIITKEQIFKAAEKCINMGPEHKPKTFKVNVHDGTVLVYGENDELLAIMPYELYTQMIEEGEENGKSK